MIDRADETELKEIARYRLAEIMLNDKQYDDALKMLDAKHGDPFAGLYADLRGDALAAAGRTADARAAYQLALAKFDAKSQYRNYVQVKLDSLGGAPAAAAVGSGSAAIVPPPPAAAAPAAPAARCCSRRARRRTDRAQAMKQRVTPTTSRTARSGRAAALVLAVVALGGCATIYEYLPVPPAFSMRWLWNSKKPGPLPELKASATGSVNWQVSVGKAVPGFAPAVLQDALYVASTDGAISRIDPATGRSVWRISAGKTLSAGPGADANVVVVGTDKGEVLAFDTNGQPKWTAKVSTEVIAPPRIADGVVAVFAGDGSVHALAAADGARKWVHQRAAPALTVRNYAGGVTTRGGLFIGTAGGRLLAIDMPTGIVGWDGTVASPKGATELERIADVTSLPVLDQQQVCAVAYQGRLACFDLNRGTLNWSREVSSLYGITVDASRLYITDDKGAVQALDKSTGASIWKQDLLAERKIGGPQVVGDLLGVVDIEGILHLMSPVNGAYVGRIATDGTPATAQPAAFLGSVLWQSAGGNLFAVTAK